MACSQSAYLDFRPLAYTTDGEVPPSPFTLMLMKKLSGILAATALVATSYASAPSGSDARARELIATLQLHELKGESGYLGLIGDSAQRAEIHGQSLKIQSQVYYMLTRDRPINYLHWLASDDTHILIEGGPVDYFIFHPDGSVEKQVLGRDLAAGQRPVVAIPGGCWKALRLHSGARYALMANALFPEWTPARVKIGAGQPWIDEYKAKAPWATEQDLKSLIGPNWQQLRRTNSN